MDLALNTKHAVQIHHEHTSVLVMNCVFSDIMISSAYFAGNVLTLNKCKNIVPKHSFSCMPSVSLLVGYESVTFP